jgi:hypothetical protein
MIELSGLLRVKKTPASMCWHRAGVERLRELALPKLAKSPTNPHISKLFNSISTLNSEKSFAPKFDATRTGVWS